MKSACLFKDLVKIRGFKIGFFPDRNRLFLAHLVTFFLSFLSYFQAIPIKLLKTSEKIGEKTLQVRLISTRVTIRLIDYTRLVTGLPNKRLFQVRLSG